MGRVVKLRVRDVESTSRGIPFGAIGCNLYWCVSDEVPTDANAYRFETMTTRAITDIVFPNDVPSGATVWISAQWVNKRRRTQHRRHADELHPPRRPSRRSGVSEEATAAADQFAASAAQIFIAIASGIRKRADQMCW